MVKIAGIGLQPHNHLGLQGSIVLCLDKEKHRTAFVCSRVVEDTEASIGDELDEMRRSFSARLRSETLQRKSDNLEKDSKINKLETMLELQLQREKDKNEKIADLEKKVEAMAQTKETPKERQMAELHEEQTTLLSRDAVTQSEKERSSETENQNRIRDNMAHVVTVEPVISKIKDDSSSTQAKDDIEMFRSQETPVHKPSHSAKQSGRMWKLPSLLKLKTSQNKIT